jgi:hypothetical protein
MPALPSRVPAVPFHAFRAAWQNTLRNHALCPRRALRREAHDRATALIEKSAAKGKVEVRIDYIPTQANTRLPTEQFEVQSRSGHDSITFPWWGPGDHAKILEDGLMAELIKQNGAATGLLSSQGRCEVALAEP